MSLTATRTHTFTVVRFADPHTTCDECAARVEGYRDPGHANHPCGHVAGYTDNCPSWGPVDGCQCAAHLGYVPHEEVSA